MLRPPAKSDMESWIALRSESADFLRKWEPEWPDDDLSPVGYMRRYRAYKQQAQTGTAKTFFLFKRSTDQLMGGLSLTRLRTGRGGHATLGYWMGERFAGRGHMSDAVPALVNHAFKRMRLGHVDAACLPHNYRSRHLLAKCGFQEIHHVPNYLEINGVLEDHVLLRRCAKTPEAVVAGYSKNTGLSRLPMV